MTAAGWAAVGGCLGALATRDLVAAAVPGIRAAVPDLARRTEDLAGVVARVGREGRDPAAGERRSLLAVTSLAALLAGSAVLGPAAGLGLAMGAPWLGARLLRMRRERYRRRVEDGAAAVAVAIADALGGGHSLRAAIAEAARGVDGAAGHELRRVASELALGARTDAALEGMRVRVGSERVDTIVTAALLQRRAGGDLARLLRSVARSFEDAERLDREVRAATAQARFTGVVVVLLPLGGALLAELASPGFLRGLATSFITAWLAGLALALQVVAAVAIRRLGRVQE